MEEKKFTPTHILTEGAKIAEVFGLGELGICTNLGADIKVAVVAFDKNSSCVIDIDDHICIVRTSDLVEIKEEPKAPHVEGFELVEITTKGGKLVYQSPFTGMQASLVSVTSNPNFAGFVYEGEADTIINHSRMFRVDNDKMLYKQCQSGIKSYSVSPKYVAFVKEV